MVKETVSHPGKSAMPAGTQGSKDAEAQDLIARRAFELYEQRGRQDGRDLEDWLDAERQLAGASSR